MNLKEKFGERVKNLRIEKGLSQEKLSTLADLDRTYIPSIEKGRRNVSIVVAQKLAKAFDLSLSELLNF